MQIVDKKENGPLFLTQFLKLSQSLCEEYILFSVMFLLHILSHTHAYMPIQNMTKF